MEFGFGLVLFLVIQLTTVSSSSVVAMSKREAIQAGTGTDLTLNRPVPLEPSTKEGESRGDVKLVEIRSETETKENPGILDSLKDRFQQVVCSVGIASSCKDKEVVKGSDKPSDNSTLPSSTQPLLENKNKAEASNVTTATNTTVKAAH